MYLFIRITYHIRSYAVLMMFVIDHSNLHTAVLLTTVWLRVVLKIDMKRYRQALEVNDFSRDTNRPGTSLGLLRPAGPTLLSLRYYFLLVLSGFQKRKQRGIL